MDLRDRDRRGPRLRVPAILVLPVLMLAAVPYASAQAWLTYARDAQHSSQGGYASQVPQQIRWSTPVDLNPQYAGNGSLYTHYGSPLITSQNTVIVPVKVNAYGGFRVESRRGTDGSLIWRLSSDYVLPSGYNWTPLFGPTLVPSDTRVVFPGAGGTVLSRSNPNGTRGNLGRLAFFGIRNYNQNPSAFNQAIQICTPITSDGAGNLFFGYLSSGVALPGYPSGIPSGLARIGADGTGSFVPAQTLSNDASYRRVPMNTAPAVTADGGSVYVAVNGGYRSSGGYLCRANATTLAPQSRVFLNDPSTSTAAFVTGDGTSSPTIGPDGDVYFGVLEARFPSHNARGWLLHFNADLSQSKTPGSFGWDLSPSIVPASAVASYTGSSSYLLLTKYNNYFGAGSGDGGNRLAILDPNATQADPITSSVQVMKEVITKLGPTAQAGKGVYEWCITSAAIDAVNHCAVVNSEDGHCYRWNFDTNTLTPGLRVADPTGQAYTPTLIGPDGAVYCVNNAGLHCCAASGGSAPSQAPPAPLAGTPVEQAAGRSFDLESRGTGPAVPRSRMRSVRRDSGDQ
jgi:hypothetical protein